MHGSLFALTATSLLATACAAPSPNPSPPPASPPADEVPVVATDQPDDEGTAAPAPEAPVAAAGAGTRKAQCDRLIRVINAEQEPLKGETGADPAALRRLAEALERVARKVRVVRELNESLADHRDAYATMATDLAAATRETATALESSDPKRAADAAQTMSDFAAREATLVEALNRYCGSEDDPSSVGPIPSPPSAAKGPFPSSNHPDLMHPKRAAKTAPPQFDVRFDTTVGDFTVTCMRQWAPHGVDRFYSLVEIGFYDDVAFFRAVKNFVVQFGMHGDPDVGKVWHKAYIPPDNVSSSNLDGYLTFAQAGRAATVGKTAAKRSTQLFINLKDNVRLDGMGFAPMCRVTRGMDVVRQIHTSYGETAGRDQAAIAAEGNAYLRETYPKLDYIKTARVVP